MDISFAVITCSDTRDLTRDEAGAALERLVLEAGWSVASRSRSLSPSLVRATRWMRTL